MATKPNSSFSIDIETLIALTQGTVLRTGAQLIYYEVSIDSRLVNEYSIFIAINGKKYSPNDGSLGIGGNFNGHDFLHEAYNKGARTFIIDDPNLSSNLSLLTDSYALLVEDSIEALGKLASWFLAKTQAKVIGITGSTGKTSTTHAISSCLNAARLYRGRTTVIGLALDILTRLTALDQFLVAEMQMDGLGQIARLCKIAPPSFAVVTCINNTHLQKLGSIENILAAKFEIRAGLNRNGKLIINGDDIYLSEWAKDHAESNVFTYGTNPRFDLYASDICTWGKLRKCIFKISYGSQQQTVKLNLIGKQAVYIGLSAAAACLLNGLHLPEICAKLERLISVPGRMQLYYGQRNSLVIDDTYNASPSSTSAAIEYWESLSATKHIAILGSMLELGRDTESEHRHLGRKLSNVADILVTVGQAANIIAQEAKRQGMSTSKILALNSVEEVISLIPFFELDGDTVVLVKGSAAMRMERITLYLIANSLI